MSPVPDETPRGPSFLKSAGLGVAVAGLGVLAVNRLKDLFTPLVAAIAVIVLLLAAAAIAAGWSVSWTWTQIFKKVWVPDFKDLEPVFTDKMTEAEKETERRSAREEIRHWKGRIFMHAIVSGLVGEALAGVGAWLLLQVMHALPPGDWRGIFCIAWALMGVMVAGSSPWVWKFVFERLWPMATGNYYAKVDADTGRVGLKNRDRPEDATIYGRSPGAADITQPRNKDDLH